MNINYVKDLHQLKQVDTQPLESFFTKHLSEYDVEAVMTQNPVPVPLSKATTTEKLCTQIMRKISYLPAHHRGMVLHT